MVDNGLAALRALLEVGLRQSRTHHYGEAIVTMERVRAAVADSEPGREVATIDAWAGFALGSCTLEATGSLPGALAILDDVAADIERAGLVELGVALAQVRGYCHARAGHADAALTAWTIPDSVWSRGQGQDQARVLLNRGNLRMEQGVLRDAADDLAQAEAIAVQHQVVELAQKARHNRGYLAHLQGDLPTALRLIGTPTAVDDPDGVAAQLLQDPIVAIDRARALLEAGLFDEADALLEDATTELAHDVRPQDQGEAHLDRARLALVTGNLATAADQARRASTCFLDQGNQRWARRAEMVRLAVEVERGQAASAADGQPVDLSEHLPAVELLIEQSARHGDHSLLVAARLMAAEVALLGGDTSAASRSLEGAEPGDADGISTRLRWHRARAELAMAAGRPAGDVMAAVTAGLGELASQQARLGSLDLRTAIAVHGLELADIGIAAALRSRDPLVVHEAVEHSKAASTRVTAVQADLPPGTAELLGQLRQASLELDRIDPEQAPKQALVLRDRVAALMGRLRTREWERGGQPDVAGVVQVRDVADRLRGHAAVAVSYFVQRGHLHALRLADGVVDVVALGSFSDVVAQAARVRGDLQALTAPGLPAPIVEVMRGSLGSGLTTLDRKLVKPLGVDGRPLVVVPHAGLAVVPWLLLPARRGLPTTVAPCLTAWCAAMERPRTRAAPVALLAGPGLHRADDEVTEAGRVWADAVVRTRAGATVAAASDAMAHAPLVHVAAHGHHHEASPMFSSLRLHDGPFFAHELAKGGGPDVVILSACELGAATVRQGDEPLGFTAALLDAGVGTVLAAITRVHDDVAHDVMASVHASLAGGVDPASALASAVAAAWDDGDVAPFTCVGAGLRPVAVAAAAGG